MASIDFTPVAEEEERTTPEAQFDVDVDATTPTEEEEEETTTTTPDLPSSKSLGRQASSTSTTSTDDAFGPRTSRSTSVTSSTSTSSSTDADEEGNGDSGIEAEASPDADADARIARQVESYFSDAGVARDKFLLKHVRRNREGFVSLKLVASFKRLRQLTRDWRDVARAVASRSDAVELNDAGTKVRRVAPLPEFLLKDDDDTAASFRGVFAAILDDAGPTVRGASDAFSPCGEISFVRVLKKGTPTPAELRHVLDASGVVADAGAWVEFEAAASARAAVGLSGVGVVGRVVPVVPERDARKNSAAAATPKNRKNSVGKNDARTDAAALPASFRPPQRRKCLSLPQTQSPNLRELASADAAERRQRPKSKSCTEFCLPASSASASASSWVQRHLLAAAAASAASASASGRPLRTPRASQGSLPLPEGVVRFPKGPDGSRGFRGVGVGGRHATPEASASASEADA